MSQPKTTQSLLEYGQSELLPNLMAAPPSINLIGQLNLVGCAQDFPLGEPGETFVHLKSTTFRSCLTEITYDSWDAFQKAEINMERVAMSSQRIPGKLSFYQSVFLSNKDLFYVSRLCR